MPPATDNSGAARRLAKELALWRAEQDEARDAQGGHSGTIAAAAGANVDVGGIERLGPVADDDLLRWEAVVNGKGIGGGYDGMSLGILRAPPGLFLQSRPAPSIFFKVQPADNRLPSPPPFPDGRWLLTISIPPSYPTHPPRVVFSTPVLHPNVSFATGEVCLDLFTTAWSPAGGIAACVRAVRHLLGYPGVDSPLNVELAALLREGDARGAKSLVRWWCREPGGRWMGR